MYMFTLVRYFNPIENLKDNERVRCFDFDLFKTEQDLRKKFADFADKLAQLYIKGVELRIRFRKKTHVYKLENPTAWVTFRSDKVYTRMLDFGNPTIKELLLKKQYLENNRPKGWLNLVKQINGKLFETVTAYNNRKIKQAQAKIYAELDAFVTQLHKDLSKELPYALKTHNPLDFFQNTAILAMEKSSEGITALAQQSEHNTELTEKERE